MSSPENEAVVLLDACVLVPIALCDTLLRFAEEPRIYRPLWSEHILAEVRRTLIAQPFRLPERKADYRIDCMTAAFPEALVTGYEKLVHGIEIPAQEDRHVVAAAIRGGAGAICTANARHFPRRAVSRFGIQVLTPDEFLVGCLQSNPGWALEKLAQQAHSRATDLQSLMNVLGKVAPQFAEAAVKSVSPGMKRL